MLGDIKLPWGHPLRRHLCLQGSRVVPQVLALLVFQGVHDHHEVQGDLLFQELPGVQVLQLDPEKRCYKM